MGAPNGSGRSAAARLEAARDATARLCTVLRCPACEKPFGPCPMQSLVCGHTLCASCAETARTSLAACPVITCRMPARPVDLCEDRTVRDIAAAAVALRSAVHASPQSNRIPSTNRAPRDSEVCVSDSDKEEEADEEDGVDPTPPPQMRVSLTGVQSAVRVSAQHALRELGAVAVELDGVQSATVLLTALDGRREFSARTRAVHYALARDVPIVDVAWAEACSVRNRWLPFGPFLASRPSKPSRPVFSNVAVFVDCGEGILGTDVANWMRFSGATIVVPGGNASLSDETRLFVHVVPDLRRETYEIGPEAVVEQCELRGIQAVLKDVPWVSDCLVSRACPPAMDVLAETMRGTLGDSMDEDVLMI